MRMLVRLRSADATAETIAWMRPEKKGNCVGGRFKGKEMQRDGDGVENTRCSKDGAGGDERKQKIAERRTADNGFR